MAEEMESEHKVLTQEYWVEVLVWKLIKNNYLQTLDYAALFVLKLILGIHKYSSTMYLGLHQAINYPCRWAKIGVHCLDYPNIPAVCNGLNSTSMLQLSK